MKTKTPRNPRCTCPYCGNKRATADGDWSWEDGWYFEYNNGGHCGVCGKSWDWYYVAQSPCPKCGGIDLEDYFSVYGVDEMVLTCECGCTFTECGGEIELEWDEEKERYVEKKAVSNA